MMLITMMNYVTVPLLLLLGFFVLMAGQQRSIPRVLFLCSCGAALISLFTGLTYDLAMEGETALALWTARFGALGGFLGYAMIFRLSLTFPEERSCRVADRVLAVFLLLWTPVVLFSPHYIRAICIRNGSMARLTGPFYYAGLGFFALLSLLSAYNFYRRYQATEERTGRSLIGFMAVLMIGVISLGALLTVVLPMVTGNYSSYPYSSIPAMLFLLGAFYIQFQYRYLTHSFRHITHLFLVTLLTVDLSMAVLALKPLWSLLHGTVWFYLVAAAVFVLFFLLNQFIQRRIVSLFSYGEQLYRRLQALLQKLSLQNRYGEILSELRYMLESELSGVKLRFLFLRQRRLVTVGEQPEQIIIDEGDPVWRMLGLHKFVLIQQGGFLEEERSRFKESRIDAVLKRLDARQALLFRDGTTLFGMIAVQYRTRSAAREEQIGKLLKRLQPSLFVYMFYLQNVRQKMLVKKVEQELQQSSRLMKRLCHAVDGWPHDRYDLAFSLRSSVALGGDYVDVIRIDEWVNLVVVGDLAGQGIPAGFSMVILRAVLRNSIKEHVDLRELAVFLNGFIRANLPREIFFAGVLMLLDRRSDRVQFINCGIPVMFLYRNEYQSIIEVQGKGYVLGFVRDISPYLEEGWFDVSAGDFLFTATDGMLDAQDQDGKRYGKEQLREILLEYRKLSAEDMVEKIGVKFDEFINQRLDDDLTMLAIRFRSSGSPARDDATETG